MTSHPDEPGAGAARRTLFVEWNEDGTVGGSHRLLFDLACNLDRARFDPVVLFYQENRFCELLEAEGIEVHLYDQVRERERSLRLNGSRLAKYADAVRAIGRRVELLRTLHVDLAHLINAPWRGSDDWLPACRVTGIPCIATAGTLLPKKPGPLQRFLVRRFNRILAVSQSVADGLGLVGITKNVQVVHPGIDVESFRAQLHKSRGEIRTELGVGATTILVTMVGNIRQWKGQHVALEALERLPADVRRNFHLLLVGATPVNDPGYSEQIRAMAEQPEVGSHVSFLGERRDVAELFSASDLALHASLSPEPFGLVLVEALAVGTPVIASNRGGPTEILTPDCGFLFDPDRPEELAMLLESLSQDRDLLARLGKAARARAEHFTAQRMAKEVQEAYVAALERRGHARMDRA